MTSIPSSQSADSTTMTQSPTEGGGQPSQGSVIIVVVVIVVVVVIIVAVLGFAWWKYSKRRKESLSFHGQSVSRLEASPSEHNSTFRALPTWEEAVNNTKTKDVESTSPYPSIQVSYCTPDLIAGTSESEINRRNATDANTPEVTFSGADERPRSSEFENPTFNMDLEGILNNSLFTSPTLLNRQISVEDRMFQNEKEDKISSKRSSVGMDNVSSSDTHKSDGPLESTKLDNESDTSTHNEVSQTVQNDERSRDNLEDNIHVDDHAIEDAIIDTATINDPELNDSPDRGIDNAGFEMDSDPAIDDSDPAIDESLHEEATPSPEMEILR